MSSGLKTMVINTRERAISTDINRLQQFLQAGQAEFARWMLNVQAGNFDVGASSTAPGTPVQTSPLSAEVINGCLFRPAVGGAGATVDAGLVAMVDPDGATSLLPAGTGSPDDSPFKLVADTGTSALALTPNSSGSTRIDVVEVARSAAKYTSTESRDIFDNISGLFSAASITKTSMDGLQYRIRTGTAGGGFPGTVQGWLPIAVCTVPTGSTTWDTVTVWDVRPLLSDRAHGVTSTSSSTPKVRAWLDGTTSPNVVGKIDAIYNGRKAGGALRRGSPGSDTNAWLDVSDAANASPSWSLTASTPAFWTMYLMFPFGLPRWSRYTDSGTGSRKPRNPLGIPVLSDTVPLATGLPSAAIALPTALGFGSVSDSGGFAVVSVGRPVSGSYRAFTMTDDLVRWTTAQRFVAFTGDDQNVSATLTAGTHYPATATEVLCNALFSWQSSNADTYTLYRQLQAGVTGLSTYYADRGRLRLTLAASGASAFFFDSVTVNVPTGHSGYANHSTVSVSMFTQVQADGDPGGDHTAIGAHLLSPNCTMFYTGYRQA